MADVAADRVRETSNTTGLGPYLLLGNVPNFRRFAQVMAAGDRCYYCAVARDGVGWETGYGTRLADGRLERTALVSSSDDGRPINWTSGLRDVFITFSPVQLGLGGSIAQSGRAGPLTGAELISALQNGAAVGIVLNDLVAYVAAALGAGTPGSAAAGFITDSAGQRLADSAGNQLATGTGGAVEEGAGGPVADGTGNRLADSAGNYLAAA